MSQIAEQTGIGRATFYKYFSDVEAILAAWNERHISHHLLYLAQVRDQAGRVGERIKAVLGAYALIRHQHSGTELAALLHRGEHFARATPTRPRHPGPAEGGRNDRRRPGRCRT